MVSAERGNLSENKSIWNSRFFKVGSIIAAVGVILGSFKAAAAGVLIAGAGWALMKSNK